MEIGHHVVVEPLNDALVGPVTDDLRHLVLEEQLGDQTIELSLQGGNVIAAGPVHIGVIIMVMNAVDGLDLAIDLLLCIVDAADDDGVQLVMHPNMTGNGVEGLDPALRQTIDVDGVALVDGYPDIGHDVVGIGGDDGQMDQHAMGERPGQDHLGDHGAGVGRDLHAVLDALIADIALGATVDRGMLPGGIVELLVADRVVAVGPDPGDVDEDLPEVGVHDDVGIVVADDLLSGDLDGGIEGNFLMDV